MPYTGLGGIWAMKNGDFQATNFAGTAAGFQGALDYCSSGGQVYLGPIALSLTSTPTFYSNLSVFGAGAKTVISMSGAVGFLNATSLSRFALKDLFIDCAAQTGTPICLSLTSCSDCRIEGIEIENATGEAVTLTASNRNRVSNVTITHPANAGVRGIVIYSGSSDNIVENCKVYNQGSGAQHHGIEIVLNSHRNLISGCYVYNSNAAGYEISGGVSGSGCHYNTISDCIADTCGRDGASAGFSAHKHCISNTFKNCVAKRTGWTNGADTSASGYEFQQGCHYTTASACKSDYSGGYGLHFEMCDWVVVSGCSIVDSGDPGLRLEDSFHATIAGNQCSRNSGGGIRLRNDGNKRSFQAVDFSQIGASNVYKSTHAQINDSNGPVVRALENGGKMLRWPGATVLTSAASSTSLTVASSATFTVGDTIAVCDNNDISAQAAVTVSAKPDATHLTVSASITALAGDRVLILSGTDLGDIDSCFYIDRPAGALYVMLSTKAAPGNDVITSGNGCNFADVSGNNCTDNGESGILLEGSSYCSVSGNVCISNGTLASFPSELPNRNGIHLRKASIGTGRSDYNCISGNNLSELRPSSTDNRQQLYGVRAEDSSCDFNLVINNTMISNKTAPVAFQTIGGNVAMSNQVSTTGMAGASIVAAATITLPDTGDCFTITGNTNITSVTASWIGREVKLMFTGTPTVTDGSNLKLNGNFVATADDTITIAQFDSSNWYELARSSN